MSKSINLVSILQCLTLVSVAACVDIGDEELQESGELEGEVSSPRREGTIYITGHRVGGVGPYHTAIEYCHTSDTCEWISAGPNSADLMISALGRPSDTPSKNKTLGTVTPPSGRGQSARNYFASLKAEDRRYCDCAEYEAVDAIRGSNTYNSNSYVNTLIRRTGGRASIALSSYQGGGLQLPSSMFR